MGDLRSLEYLPKQVGGCLRALVWVALLGACADPTWAGERAAPKFQGLLSTAVPLDPAAKRPAGDLIHQGRLIDETEAADLIRQGVELWRLNPQESRLWSDQRLELSNEPAQGYPEDGATVRYDSLLAMPSGLFRASVDALVSGDPGRGRAARIKPFTLTVSYSNNAALMRAALLRSLGYDVTNPKLYRALTVTFASIAERDAFLVKISDGARTDPARWVRDLPADKPQVTLKSVVLEPGRVDVMTLHWGLMRREVQQDRRVFRALLVPTVLLDIAQRLNLFAWDPTRVAVGNIVFNYMDIESSLSEAFADATVDDLKWVVARMARLERGDFVRIVAFAGLPDDVSRLLVEKLVSRRNALVRSLGLGAEFPLLAYDPQLTVGNVSRGVLLKDADLDDPYDFYNVPNLPPLRFSQLWRYGAIEGLSAGIGTLLGQINSNLLTYQSPGSAQSKHAQDVSNGVASYLAKTGSLTGFQQNAGVWGMPLLGANINASRTVVAGTYLGSDSQVQLVDSLSVSASSGFFVGWDGIAPVATPAVSGQVTFMRSYTHVKPVEDMNSALKTNWARVVTAGYMMHLSKVLNPDIRCSIPEGPWTAEVEIEGAKFTKIHYDKNRANGKEEALAKRAQLIQQGVSPDVIVLQADDRDADCKANIEDAVKENLGKFADGLPVGDTFVITDSVQLGSSQTVNIPLTVLAGVFDVSVAPNANQNYQIQRQTMIRKTKDGFQVYLQDSRMESYNFGMDFNFYINVFKAIRENRRGHAETDFYNVVTEGASVETKQKLIRSLKALMFANDPSTLVANFEPYTLKQDLFARIAKYKFLLWSLSNQTQNLNVDIYPPIDRNGKRNRGDYKRTLSMNKMVTQTGQDWFGFLMGIGTRLSGGYVTLPGANGGGDPGNSPGGKSFTGSISTQAEVTPGAAFNPVTIVQQTYRGWTISRNSLFKIFDRVEGVYGSILTPRAPYKRGLFDRTLFNNTSRLELYQLETTLLFYPKTLAKVRGWVTSPEERKLFDFLMRLGGSRATMYCEVADTEFGRTAGQIYRGNGFKACAPSWVHSLMRMRKEGPPSDRRQAIAWYNSMMSYLINNVDIPAFLKALGPDFFFFSTRVNGFRRNDVLGTLDGYLFDTVGHYDGELGSGIFRDFANQYGISQFQLYAQFFTDGL